MIRRITSGVLSGLFPQPCLSCTDHPEDPQLGTACRLCWESTQFFNDSEVLCSKCGGFYGGAPRAVRVECPHCREHLYDHAFSLGLYHYALRACIVRLKTNPKLRRGIKEAIDRSFARTFSERILPDIVMPVPLSKKRLIQRGFNQAGVIAAAVASRVGLDLDDYSLIRKIHTNAHRAGMDKIARSRSVDGAFDVIRPRLVNGRTILLIDDVFTTGATANACAETLKNAGSGEIIVFTLARAFYDQIN